MHFTIIYQRRILEMLMSSDGKVIIHIFHIKIDTLKISQLLTDLFFKVISISILNRNNHLNTITLICRCFIKKIYCVYIITFVHHILTLHSILSSYKIETRRICKRCFETQSHHAKLCVAVTLGGFTIFTNDVLYIISI